MNTEQIETLGRIYKEGLLEDTIPFWTRHAVDREHGGFMTCLDRDGSVLDTDKSIWAQGRFTWMLATLYNTVEQRDEWLDLAKHGIDFISGHGFDETDGRMWFVVTRDGKPVRKRRYVFSEAFAAIAHAAYAKAADDEAAGEQAIQLFEQFARYNTEPGLIPPKTNPETRPMMGIGPWMILINMGQVLRDTIACEMADAWIDRAIKEIRTYFVKPDLEVVLETCGPEGEVIDHFDGRTLNPGHAIEAAWFILHEAKHRNDADLTKLGTQMLDWMWKRGWDEEYGGILYFRDVYGKPVQEYWHDMKFWWPQNETLIATLLAYQLTGDEQYIDKHQQIHDWAYAHFPDPEHGEWYGYLHRDGRVSVPLKGNLWKGPFHLPRMHWYCAQVCEEMLANGES